VPLLKAAAQVNNIPLVAVPHPIAGAGDDAVRKKADDAIEQLISSLVTSREESTT